MSEQKKAKIRANIDSIDNELVELLSKRLDLVRQLAELKNPAQLRDEKRQKEIINRLIKDEKIEAEHIENLYNIIFDISIYELEKCFIKK